MRILPLLAACMAAIAPAQEREILTPKPGRAPSIHGPKVYGARPGHPFLYRIPCTGERPMKFTVSGLPPSLRLDAQTGIVSGETPARRGDYELTLRARNQFGSSTRKFKVVVGDTLALTPPLGWNHWYAHYAQITDALVREAADKMISSGMADAGYQYVNLDDCWMMKPGDPDPTLGGPPRDSGGAILANRRFPDMKALTAYIHSKGLKAGIYTGPGPLTCARYTASYQHEELDAKRFAEWGFDFLKYDLCSYRQIVPNPSLDERKKPYEQMGRIVQQLNRDVVFNLCQYGAGAVWEWGAEVGGQCWRTTGDVGLEKDARLPGFYSIGLSNARHSEFAGPGRWNDPDYILIGHIGNTHKREAPPQPTTLTPDEQYSYMSMWSLMAAPLLFSGDMGKLDDFTLNVLCNTEVIDVNQDALGKQARILRQNEDELVLVKPLEDGSQAVGLFNLAQTARTLTIASSDLGWNGPMRVRDVWRQKDLEGKTAEYKVRVAPHGVALVRTQAGK
jgi:alpha-galactosidase